MARARCLPPTLLDDPDYFELNGDIQAILLGLVLCADDHGRGMAHTGWLARKLNRDISVIEAALAELESHHMLLRYQVEQQHYYILLKWWQWQAGLYKPARPLYPEPPQQHEEIHLKLSPTFSKKVGESLRNSEKLQNSPLEVEGEEEVEVEIESESESEVEGEEESHPVNVVTFPTTPRHDAADGECEKKSEQDLLAQIAHILRLSPDEALLRIVQDYRASPGLSLLGEADAAREWIDSSSSNKQRKKMTPAFFRRWLKRECESRQRQQETTLLSQQHEIKAASRAQSGASPGTGLASQSLMDLEQRYRREKGGSG